MLRYGATPALAVACLVVACTQGPSPSQADWFVSSAGSQPLDQGMIATRSARNEVTLRLTIPGAGSSGCSKPEITGVGRSGDTISVHVNRAPAGPQCLVTGDITFKIEVRGGTADGALLATSNDACAFAGCLGRAVPIAGE